MVRRIYLYLHPFANTRNVSVINHDISSFIDFERSCIFVCINAKSYNVPSEFFYGQLKQNRGFTLPDGLIVYGAHFIQSYYLKFQVAPLNYIARKRDVDIFSKAVYAVYN